MITTILIFIFILGLLVFVHELGHFLAAKKAGVKVEEFGFGFPPRLFGFKKGETTYSINWIPLGGFVKILGEDGVSKKDPRSFASQKFLKKIIILAAGVTMNVVLAAVILIIGFKIGLPLALTDDQNNVQFRDPKIQIYQIAPDSPAEQANLKVGDQIIKINGEEPANISTVQNIIKERAGQEVTLKLLSGGENKDLKVIPRVNPPATEGHLGIGLVKTGIVSYSFGQSIVKGVTSVFTLTLTIILAFAEIIKNLVLGEKVALEVAGPVGIAVMTNQAAKMGFVYLLQFTALLSLNLAIINILPLPALDGGRIFFALIEKIRKKPLNQRFEQTVHTIGFSLLILLMAVVTFRDIVKFKDIFINLWQKITHLF